MGVPTATRPADDPRNGPVVLRSELVAIGHDDRSILRLRKAGELVKIRHGAYVPGAIWAGLDEAGRYGLRGRAVLRQARTPVVLSHLSALPEYGAPTWGFDLDDVHVTRTDGCGGRSEAGVRQHRGQLRAADFVVLNQVPVTNPARVVIETATLGRTEAAFAVANFMLHEKLTTVRDLQTQYVGMEQWPDTLGVEIVLRLADGRLESVGESRTLWFCFQQRLPLPVPQYEIRDERGSVVARVDFAWPRQGVFLEFDGRVKYEKLLKDGERASDVVLREKAREELICALTGWRCVRVTWTDLQHPHRLASRLRSALSSVHV